MIIFLNGKLVIRIITKARSGKLTSALGMTNSVCLVPREGKRWLRHYFEENSRFLCAVTGKETAQKSFYATILGKTSNFSA